MGALTRFLFHTSVAAYMVHSYLSIGTVLGKALEAEYGGDLQFLTVIGMITACITMALGALNDIMPFPALHGLKRLFGLVALPVEITISAIYWPLIIFAPHFMLPPVDAVPKALTVPNPDSALVFLPLWMDLGLHAVPALSLIIDFFFLEKKYQKPMKDTVAFFMTLLFGIGYCSWVEHCNNHNGHFPYPFLTMMDLNQRTQVYFGASLFALLVFRLLNGLHK